MQFEVATHRMATELSAPISLESLPYQSRGSWTPRMPSSWDGALGTGQVGWRDTHEANLSTPIATAPGESALVAL